MTFYPESELILNADGSVYHLGLLPEHIGDTIITVGDPERVAKVSQYFDEIWIQKSVREFVTHTGIFKGKKITVISTGIGTDNIDIVFNELDALVNIDLKTRTEKTEHHSLNIIRIGTSGSLQEDIEVDSILASSYGVDLGPLQHFYPTSDQENTTLDIKDSFQKVLIQEGLHIPIAVTPASTLLLEKIAKGFHRGITLTAPGFYGPQGRSLRGKSTLKESFFSAVSTLSIQGHRVTNFEMETAGIYTMATLLGHRALSINLILANRQSKKFSTQGSEGMESLILDVLNRIVTEL